MVSSLFSSNNSIAAVRRPALSIEFAAGGGGAGGLGGLAGAAAGALGIGTGGSTDPWQQTLVSLRVDLGIAPFVDGVEVILATGEQAPAVALEDEGTVSLGYADSAPELVFTGAIANLQHSLHGVTHLTATSGSARLSRLRLNQSYEQQTAGQIVQDLAGRAEVSTDTIEDGIDLPFYVIDDRRTAYQHIAILARKSGYLSYFTPKGKLNFAPAQAEAVVQTFTYGVDILALDVMETTPAIANVTTVGEGAAGSQGQNAWGWLIKDPAAVQGNSGSDPPQRLVSDASLRSQDAAQTAATALVDAANRMSINGRLLVPGSSTVTVGSAIEITAAPTAAFNGTFLVHHLSHHYSKQEGFKTVIEFCQGNG